ncbi:MAG: hypothetical protein GY926_22870 [bacterium]|nr:hypothetical protein [bacterium]
MNVDIRNVPPPAEWGVTISQEAVDRLADQWQDRSFPLPDWDYKGLPQGLDDENWYNVCVIACSVLACIWPPDGDGMWTTHYEGDDLDDAPAVFSCFSRRIEDGHLDLDMFATVSGPEFFAGSGTLQLVDEKWAQLRAAVDAIKTRWNGSVGTLVAAGNLDAEQIVDLLVETIPGFDDAPLSPVGKLPFHKLARLATAMMSAGGSTPFSGLDRLPVYPDYMLPRVFRHVGIMEYSDELATAIDSRQLVPKESSWELGIRWATVYCGDRLAESLQARGVAVTTPALDYALWESAVLGPDADRMGEHHRTLTLAY